MPRQCTNCSSIKTEEEFYRRVEKNLVVDHDHETEVIRGLLCSSCNVGIGMLKDSIDNLNSAINYLSRKS